MPYLRLVSLKQDKPVPDTEYPFTIPAVRNLGELVFAPNVTFLVGENGTGKSTLMEAIAVALGMNAEGGGRNFKFFHSTLALRPLAAFATGKIVVPSEGPVLSARRELLQRGYAD